VDRAHHSQIYLVGFDPERSKTGRNELVCWSRAVHLGSQPYLAVIVHRRRRTPAGGGEGQNPVPQPWP
jgi:hypothetical protein